MRTYQYIIWFTQSPRLIILLIVTLFFQITMYTKSACIIVHGTWAKNTEWYRPSGDFFKAVQQCNNENDFVNDVISFTWSGKLGYPAQLQAAQELVEVIDQYDSVILIAHSHGSTVGMIASAILSEKISSCVNFTKITKFYSLGVPVQSSILQPSMDVIDKFYNLFSFGDLVQTVNGVYERVFEQHNRIFNLSVELLDHHPAHSDLHDPIIGKHLLCIDEHYAQCCVGNFNTFNCNPGKVSFTENIAPIYTFQEDQKKLLELDKQAHALSVLAFFRSNTLTHEISESTDCWGL